MRPNMSHILKPKSGVQYANLTRAGGPTGIAGLEGEQTLPPPREVQVLQAVD